MKLVFGVQDVPYSPHGGLSPTQRRTLRWRLGKRPWQSLASQTTTGEVAEILERRYGVFGFYWQQHQGEILNELQNVLLGKVQNALMGQAPSSAMLFSPGDLSAIETGFRQMIDARELDGKVPGVPTQASLRGVNHRLARPYAKSNPVRPSFFDTSLYYQSVRVWFEP
jgi:hypothetical protein